jgi:DNA-binding response OmpR family regulator
MTTLAEAEEALKLARVALAEAQDAMRRFAVGMRQADRALERAAIAVEAVKQVPHNAPDDLVRAIEGLGLPRRELRLADFLMRAYPRHITRELLSEFMYGDELLSIARPHNMVEQHIFWLRKRLVGSGWGITSERHLGYRFDDEAKAKCYRSPKRAKTLTAPIHAHKGWS